MKPSSLAVDFTRKMIQIESTDPGTCEKDMADWLTRQLSPLPGVRLTREEVLPGRPNLMAELPGPDDTPALVMICHMDTVVVGDGWTMDPFAAYEKDGLIYGRGACDMKSGLACCLSAFTAAAGQLHESGIPARRKLKLICTMDEEDFMRGSEACIRSGWVTDKDWIIDAEPTDGRIQASHKGRTWYEIEVQGHTAHASTPWKGADAIAAMAEIIRSVRLDIQAAPSHPDMGTSTVTFGQITGGYRPYVVPDSCKLWIDMRPVPPLNTEKTNQIVEKAIQTAMIEVPGVSVSYRITGDRPSIEKDPDSLLLAHLKKACTNITSRETEVTCFTGYTDTAVIAGQLHNHNCMSYGPGSLEAAHQPDEWVAVEDIIRCEKVYIELIQLTVLS